MPFSVLVRTMSAALLAALALTGMADLTAAHGALPDARATAVRVGPAPVLPDCGACGAGF